MYGNAGTPIFQPPEQINSQFHYSKGADIWACGLIIYKLLTNRHPFINTVMNREQITDKVLGFTGLDFKNSKISSHAQHLLKRMIAREQSHRYSANEALQHPWITRKFDDPYPMTKAESSTADFIKA